LCDSECKECEWNKSDKCTRCSDGKYLKWESCRDCHPLCKTCDNDHDEK